MQPHPGWALQPNSGGFVQIVSTAASVVALAVTEQAGSRPPPLNSLRRLTWDALEEEAGPDQLDEEK